MTTFYNRYLDQALKRREQNRLRYKDLYYREAMIFHKTLDHSLKCKDPSFYDYILDSYQFTIAHNFPTFTFVINDYSWVLFMCKNRDMVIHCLSQFQIYKFTFGYAESYPKGRYTLLPSEIGGLFISKRTVLPEEAVTVDEESGEVLIHGDFTTCKLL